MSLALMALGVQAQTVNIPDANFKAALLAAHVDLNDDGNIQVTEAAKVTVLNIENKSINSLVGIEAFIALRVLKVSTNNLGYLDLSKNVVLDSLFANNAGLVTLNISGTLTLRYVSVTNNPRLTKICISIAQKVLVITWIKDAIVTVTTECSSAGVIEDVKTAATKKELLHVYNQLGQEVPVSQTNDGGVYIYKYSDGSFSRIAKF